MKHIYILIILSMIVSCSKNEQALFLDSPANIVEFKKRTSIKGERINLDLLGATNLHTIDTFIIFQTPKMEKLYSVYTTSSILCANLVNKGQGPDEFPADLIPIYNVKKDSILIMFYNYMSNEIQYMNLLESIKDNKVQLSKPIRINIDNIYRIYPLDNNNYFIDYLDIANMSQHYAVWDNDKNILEEDHISLNANSISIDNSYLLGTYCCYNKKKRVYASAMRFIDQVNFFSIENPKKSFCISLNNKTTNINNIEKTEMPKKIEYYNDLRSSDSYLYALYTNQNRKDWAVGDTPAKIQVFDWDGNPILEIETKEKLIHFDIDTVQNRIYGITEKEELYSYELPDIIKM